MNDLLQLDVHKTANPALGDGELNTGVSENEMVGSVGIN